MENFFPNQRWTSEGEPELGIGIVMEAPFGRVKILFPASGEVRMYSAETAPLRRVTFKVGDTILDMDQREMVIERVKEENGLFIYYGQGNIISESELGDVTVNTA